MRYERIGGVRAGQPGVRGCPRPAPLFEFLALDQARVFRYELREILTRIATLLAETRRSPSGARDQGQAAPSAGTRLWPPTRPARRRSTNPATMGKRPRSDRTTGSAAPRCPAWMSRTSRMRRCSRPRGSP